MTTQLISAGRARGATGLGYGVPQSGAATTPVSEGGIVELSTSTVLRPSLDAAAIAAFMPSTRSQFTFPAPYNTKVWRITLPADTTNDGDGVEYNGYSYWNKMSHNGDALYILVGLNGIYGRAANTGANYYILTKSTGVVTGPFPIFDIADGHHNVLTTEMYFSPTLPTKVYYTVTDDPVFRRVDILTGVKTTVCDLNSAPAVALIGVANCSPGFAHTSYDEKVHCFLVRAPSAFSPSNDKLGFAVYHEDTGAWQYFPRSNGDAHDERSVLDCSGQYVQTSCYFTTNPAPYGPSTPYYRVTRLSDGRITKTTPDNGHLCQGYNYLVGAQVPANTLFPSYRLYNMATDPFDDVGVRDVYRDNSFHDNPAFPSAITSSCGHVSWINSTNTDPATQYCGASGPGVGRGVVDSPRANELYCIWLDGSYRTLVIAPTMCSRDSSGGDQGVPNYDYAKMAKASICMQGRYMCWTTNLCGNRLDMFVVQVPRNVVGWDI